MNKKIYAIMLGLGALLLGSNTYAQIQDEQNVTITMDLQPVLQLYMQTSDQVNFVFDNIASYEGGEIKYGATILKVSSSINWDLYAVGTSTNGNTWDNQLSYSTPTVNSTTSISLGALELHQYPADPAAYPDYVPGCAQKDYSASFATPLPTGSYTPGNNNVYFNANPYSAPGVSDKYIAGGKGTNVGDQMIGGSYLDPAASISSGFYYVIDYRIVPGLPVIFPDATTEDNCATADPNKITSPKYAQSGVYTMDVKYVLLEDQ